MRRSARRQREEHPDLSPEWIRPQLTELVKEAPSGPEWLHEIKFDGYRMHARLHRGRVRLLTRTGLDWTHKYPAIAAAVAALPADQAYLDGELCGVRPDGTTSFSLMQAASDTGNAAALVFFCSTCSIWTARRSERHRFGTGRSGSAVCCLEAARRCSSAITKSGAGRSSTRRRASYR